MGVQLSQRGLPMGRKWETPEIEASMVPSRATDIAFGWRGSVLKWGEG